MAAVLMGLLLELLLVGQSSAMFQNPLTREEQGRLTSHDYAHVRDAFLDACEDSSSEECSSGDSSGGEESSDSDDEGYFAGLMIGHWRAIKTRQLTYPPELWISQPWEVMSPGEFEWWARFTPDEMIRLDDQLTLCPECIPNSVGRPPASRRLALTIVLMRLAGSDIGRPWRFIAEALQTNEQYLASTFAQMIFTMGVAYRVLATCIDVKRISTVLEPMAEAARRLGATVYPCVAAPDGNHRATTRCHRSFGNDAQQAFYQGRLHSHGVSKHDVAFFDGTHVTFIGSAADNDLGLLKRSRQVEAFEFLVLPDGTPVCMIGDQAYYGYPSQSVAAKPRGLIDKMAQAWWSANNTSRAISEDSFGLQVRLWPFVENRKQLKLYRKTRYSVRDLLLVVTVLTNAYVTVHGSQVTATMKVDPPSMEEYFENANARTIPDMHGPDP